MCWGQLREELGEEDSRRWEWQGWRPWAHSACLRTGDRCGHSAEGERGRAEWGEAGGPGKWRGGVWVSFESHGKPSQCLVHRQAGAWHTGAWLN